MPQLRMHGDDVKTLLVLIILNASYIVASEPQAKRSKFEIDQITKSMQGLKDVLIDQSIKNLNSMDPFEPLNELIHLESRRDLVGILIEKLCTHKEGFREDIATAIFLILKRNQGVSSWVRLNIKSNKDLMDSIKANKQHLYDELVKAS